MSVKIWTAYRLRKSEYLWSLVHDIRLKAKKNVIDTLAKLYQSHLPHVNTDTELYQSRLKPYLTNYPPERAEYLARLSVVQDIFRRAYRFSTTRPERSPYNFDVSVGFRQYKGAIIVIPYCDSMVRNVLDFLREDKRLRDYHYQNQTDRPKGLSNRVWSERRRFYSGMDEDDLWEDVLVLDICKWDMWYQLDPWLSLMNLENS